MPERGNPRRGWKADSLGREPVGTGRRELHEPPQGGDTRLPGLGRCASGLLVSTVKLYDGAVHVVTVVSKQTVCYLFRQLV